LAKRRACKASGSTLLTNRHINYRGAIRWLTVSNDVVNDERIHNREWAAEHGLRSFAGFPLKRRGEVIGVVAMFSRQVLHSQLLEVLDLLSHSEIVTNYDQNDDMTLRRVCQILDKVRPYKRIFSADILGFPDWNQHHALSCLTMIILARKIMGLGVDRLLGYHTKAKRQQAALFNNEALGSRRCNWDYWSILEDKERESPIEEGELLEVLNWVR